MANKKNGIARRLIWLGLIGAALSPHLEAETVNPYGSIVERNPFGLKPPTPPPDPASLASANTVPNTLKLTGLVRERGVAKASIYIVVPPRDGRSENLFTTLAVGEKEFNIEMLSIDEKNESVQIKNAGSPMTLSFKENSFKPQGAPPQVAAIPGAMQTPPGMNLGIPPNPGMATYGGGAISSPGAMVNPGGMPTSPNGIPTTYTPPIPGQVNMNINNQQVTIPTRNLRTSQVVPEHSYSQGGDPAVQYANLSLQKAALEKRGIPMPPLPPIPGLTPQE